MIKGFFIFLLLLSPSAKALVGFESLESKLFQSNQELSSLKQQVESKEALYSSTTSGFLPTINAVGGWAQNKTDDLATVEKGTIGYIEAKYNLFNGFKDYSVSNEKEINLQLARIDLEEKHRALRSELTEAVSEMIYLHKLQNILDEETKTTQLQKQMAAKKVAAGLTGQVDNLEFDMRGSEIEVEKNQIDQLHNEVHQKLVKLFGKEMAESELEQVVFASIDHLSKTSQELKLENSLGYQKSKLNLSKSQSAKTESRSDFLPKLDFTMNVGRLTPSENTPVQFNENKYAVTLTIPLFSGFDTYYKTKSASLEVLAAERSLAQKISDVQSEFNILKAKAIELIKLYKINEIKLVNSQQYFDLTLGEYKRGVKNSPDLVSATERLYSSKKKKFEILKELEILKVKIENI